MNKQGTDHEKQIEEVFHELWVERGDNYEDDALAGDTLDRYNDWSDGKITSYVQDCFDKNATEPMRIFDAGCGLEFGFNSIFNSYKERIEYTGVDLIDLVRTEEFLSNRGYNHRLIRVNMVDLPPDVPRDYYDIVIAIGTLHHTESVVKALTSTYSVLKQGGLFAGWIINVQKPVRAATDQYFREFFDGKENSPKAHKEIIALAKFCHSLGQVLGSQKVAVPEDVAVLDLPAGEYTIQTLVYDYIVKFYHVKGHSLERTYDQLFDWFMPKWYHQTSSEELEEMIESLSPSRSHIVTKTNGHFFFIYK